MMLPIIPQDKANHFVYGCFLAGAGALHSVEAGIAICAIFAVAKEVRDKLSGKGTPELADFFWTVLPTVPMFTHLIL
jgi:hypothetical protein